MLVTAPKLKEIRELQVQRLKIDREYARKRAIVNSRIDEIRQCCPHINTKEERNPVDDKPYQVCLWCDKILTQYDIAYCKAKIRIMAELNLSNNLVDFK